MNINLAAVSRLAGDGYCGTPVPGHPHPPSPLDALKGILDRIGLNPQPLPPREGGVPGRAGMVADYDDGPRCGNEPHKFPFPFPQPGPRFDSVVQTAINALQQLQVR